MLRGVRFFDQSAHQGGIQAVLDTNSQGKVYVVDTFVTPNIYNGLDLRRALAHSLGLSEWYGYDIVTLINQVLVRPEAFHTLVLVISPNHQHLLDRQVLQALSDAHDIGIEAGRNFWTLVFQSPVAHRPPAL